MALLLTSVQAKSFSSADGAKIGARAKIDGDGAGGGSEGQRSTLALRRVIYSFKIISMHGSLLFMIFLKFRDRERVEKGCCHVP